MSLELALKGLIAEVLTEAGLIASAVTSVPAGTPAAASPPAPAPRRGRGRPVTGESPPPPASAVPSASPAATEPDPFAEALAAPAAAPTATLDEVRAALTALKNATDQATALKVLKDVGGASNLADLQKTPDKYGAVVQAAKAALPGATPAAEPDDPFATETAAEPIPTKEEVRAAIVAAQKRTGADIVQKVVMEHGGVAVGSNGVKGPSLQALPESAYAAVVKAVNALPTTK